MWIMKLWKLVQRGEAPALTLNWQFIEREGKGWVFVRVFIWLSMGKLIKKSIPYVAMIYLQFG